MTKETQKAVAYLRTSSKANVGADKDSDKRQRGAIEAYAKSAGFDIVAEFYDQAVSGADPITDRPGFAEMLTALLANGARTILVESPDRFARDLMVQLAGHDMLKAKDHADCGQRADVLRRGHRDRRPGPAGARRRRAVREDDQRGQARKAPQVGYWCLGQWSKVKRPPEMNSENDAIEDRFARQ